MTLVLIIALAFTTREEILVGEDHSIEWEVKSSKHVERERTIFDLA